MSDDERVAELHNRIGHWYTVLVFARSKFARTGAVEDRDSVTFAEAKMNQYEDQLLALKGVPGPGGEAPFCTSAGCTQRMASFGTRVWLCPECDFRECVGCRQRVHSFTVVNCPHCGFTIAAPRSVDDELD